MIDVVREFEELLESYYPNTRAIAVNSGTSALIACLKSLELHSTSQVITTPYTFIATSDAIVLAGAKPIFADINRDNLLLNQYCVYDTYGRYTGAILPVNLFGNICTDLISYFGREKDVPVIEDSAQSFLHPDNMVTISDAQCFSFYKTKNLQGGEGGAIVVRNDGLLDYEKIWSICNNGRFRGRPKYEHYNIGYNFKMSEHVALILYNQLKYHPEAIRAELGKYNQMNGYYPEVIYKQPSYQRLGISGNCPVAEAEAEKVAKMRKKTENTLDKGPWFV